MLAAPTDLLRVFVVYEPSYWRGFMATIGSMARHSSQVLKVDVMTRPAYVPDLERRIARLSKAVGDKVEFSTVVVPASVLEICDGFNFQAHFIPEVLFRLYYFDIIDTPAEYFAHVDIDMIWRADIYGLIYELGDAPFLNALPDKLSDVSRPVMPPGIDTYLNAGLMVFHVKDLASARAVMRGVQDIVPAIASKSAYLDQDALMIGLGADMGKLHPKWNFMTKNIGSADPEDAANLHATGSRKPWHWRGGHPFTRYYDEETRAAGLSIFEAYDFVWAARKLAKRLRLR